MNLGSSWRYLEGVSRSRLAHNKTRHHIYEYGTEIELLGCCGELVVRRFLGLGERLHTEFDGGCDLVWRGRKIDVKATRLTPRLNFRNLQWPLSKKVKADIVVMTAVNIEDRFGIVVGWCWGSKVSQSAVNRERFVACYEMPITELEPPWKLMVI